MVNYPQQYPYYQSYPTYQQQYQQPIQTQQPLVVQQPPNQNQVLAWIKNDEKEAIDYPLSPGQSIFLMTQDEKYLYAKSCDQLGKVSLIKKRLEDETDNSTQKIDLDDYIRKEEIENLITDKIQREIEKKFNEISFKPTKARKQVIIDEE